MRFLVTSHSGVFAYSEDFVCEHARPGYFYGADVLSDGRIAICERYDPTLEPDSPTRLWVIEPSGDGITLLLHDVKNVHQATAIDDHLYICDTRHDRVVLYNPSSEALTSAINFAGDEVLDHDTYHINSVTPTPDGEIAVLLHNRGITESQIAIVRDGSLHRIYKLAHRSCHNVVFHNGFIYYNASSEGRVIRATPDGKEQEVLPVGGHPKGLAVHDSTLYVGVSGVASREHRFTIESHVAVVDTVSGSFTDMIPLRGPDNGPIGNINEIRVIP